MTGEVIKRGNTYIAVLLKIHTSGFEPKESDRCKQAVISLLKWGGPGRGTYIVSILSHSPKTDVVGFV